MSAIRALALMNVMLKAGMPYHAALASSRGIARGAHGRLIDRAFRVTLLGNCPSLEFAIEKETEALPRRLAWVGRALREYMICGTEADQPRREEMLDRAFSSALDSCRQSLKESVSGLRVPVSTIFALGIVLPIVLATMLPLWGAAYSDGISHGFSALYDDEQPSQDFPTYALAAPVLLFPALSLIASARVLSKGEFAPLRGEGTRIPLMLALLGVMGAAAFVVLFILRLEVNELLFASVAISASMLACRLLDSGSARGVRDSMYDHPSELNAISARLMSGEHFVRAAALESENRAEKGSLFWRAMGAAPDDQGGFDGEMLKLISATAKSDSCLAAQVLRQVARHLNDLKMVRTELGFELRPIAQSVLVATVFLSPFVLGIAAGFESISATAGSPVGNLFVAFIVEMVMAGLWLVRSLGVGDGFLGYVARHPSVALGASGLGFLISLEFSKSMFA